MSIPSIRLEGESARSTPPTRPVPNKTINTRIGRGIFSTIIAPLPSLLLRGWGRREGRVKGRGREGRGGGGGGARSDGRVTIFIVRFPDSRRRPWVYFLDGVETTLV